LRRDEIQSGRDRQDQFRSTTMQAGGKTSSERNGEPQRLSSNLDSGSTSKKNLHAH